MGQQGLPPGSKTFEFYAMSGQETTGWGGLFGTAALVREDLRL